MPAHAEPRSLYLSLDIRYLSNEGNHGPGSLSVFYVFVAEEADEKFLFACEGGFFLVSYLFFVFILYVRA